MYKKILIFVVVSVISLGTFLKFMAHNEKDFIYVVPKIKYIEVLDKNIGEYSILKWEIFWMEKFFSMFQMEITY